ncbi:unnamed protein product [Pneumocystis jirovecii]|uniref:ATP synthase subunit delta, mitochondrial n=2 Tax=Pneumocystis jirovecii TaxID=42068 RepID=L0PBK9_PNEJI|nr:F1F0 ATP synthase subunit delta [Pneumocystis jirovecii RU7]KTW31070.1 hypothetical protein T551_01622 [Pneumocystis jirovecii RU7]CCJ29758.1 unnamed protein product [Pneumocystis jirovecii]
MSLIRTSVRQFLHTRGFLRFSSRGYAKEVSTDKICLTFSLPHNVLYNAQNVTQVNIPATSGNMGILALHVPSIEQLRPGIVDVIEENGISNKFFVSGGFAIVQPGSSLCINAIEAYSLDDFSLETVSEKLQEAQKIVSGNGSEEDIAEAKIQIEVLESLRESLK